MCTTCGCGTDEAKLDGVVHAHTHAHNGLRIVDIEQSILNKNQSYADSVRLKFKEKNIFALNLVSSPGAGKTSLLVATIKKLNDNHQCAVIEGDQQTSHDADKIKAAGAEAIQINTGKGCHLDAHMVEHALDKLDLSDKEIVFIENVGNLVCPSAFDLGEAHKVVILSTTEGEDKPLKYPDMFDAADLMIINKIDLLPYLDFNLDLCKEYALRINPNLKIIELSVKTGEGMESWFSVLRNASLDSVGFVPDIEQNKIVI